MRYIILFFILFSINRLCISQVPEIFTDKNRIKIGVPVDIKLKFIYPSQWEVFFADSSYAYSPFEFLSKQYFPTKTENNTSIDSTYYSLAYFGEKDTVELSLPIFVFYTDHTDTIYSDTITFIIERLITQLPSNPAVKENTEFVAMKNPTDLFFLFSVLGTIFLFVFFLLFIFRKKIKKLYRLQQLKRRNIRFILQFDKLIYENLDKQAVREALYLWKLYVSKLKNHPLLPLSSIEIAAIVKNKKLYESLNSIDNFIYGDIKPEDMKQIFLSLKQIAMEYYQQNITQIKSIEKNGKKPRD